MTAPRVLADATDAWMERFVPSPGVRRFERGEPVQVGKVALSNMWSQIEPTTTCWIWHGQLDEEGYGRYNGRPAHRVVYERVLGVVPRDLQLDHLCRNRHCVNPAHLEPVTPAENSRRSNPFRRFGRFTYCPNGHEYTPENTAPPEVSKSRGAKCITCYQTKMERTCERRKRERRGEL